MPKLTPLIFIVLGVVSIILPITRPDIFFPLLWLALFFLLDPLNYWLGEPSFIRDTIHGDWSRVLYAMSAALISGFFWELWNAYANPSWYYVVPYVGQFKIFEMPVLGFLGYLPFGLEVFAFYTFLRHVFSYPQQKYTMLSNSLTQIYTVRFANWHYGKRRVFKRFIVSVTVILCVLLFMNVIFLKLKENSSVGLNDRVINPSHLAEYLSANQVTSLVPGEVVNCQYAFVPGFCLRTDGNEVFFLVNDNGQAVSADLGYYYIDGQVVLPENEIGLPNLVVDNIYYIK